MNFSEIINNKDVSSQLKRYNRYMNEHNDEIEFVKEDIRSELLKLYGNVASKLDGTLYVLLNKEATDMDKDLVNNIIVNSINSHTPGMPDFLKEHLFELHCIGDEMFIKIK